MTGKSQFDAIIVGGGPAGSAMAWALAREGVRVAVIERTTFPREKVCGDFVEPAGMRILDVMGCTEELDLPRRLPITRNRVYFGPRMPYRGEIPYYDGAHGMPPHGYIIPRHQLDTVLLSNAEKTGANVIYGATVRDVTRDKGQMHVEVKDQDSTFTLTAPLVVGADGVQSVVARAFGLRREDRKHIGVSQRVYIEDIDVDGGEATIWFDEDHYPGYGWMFPMEGGRANMGVGLLGETCDRFDLSVQQSFRDAVSRLKFRHPGCTVSKVASKPLGGSVHMYGGIRENHFAGGILVGDAGGFVDPMTGEGITQGMESSIIGSATLLEALEAGRFEKEDLATFDEDFRDYFDPAMRYLCFCATILRNRHFSEFGFRSTRQGFEKAQQERSFGEISGTAFGGLNVQPLAMAAQIWRSLFEHVFRGGAAEIVNIVSGRGLTADGLGGDLAAFRRGWQASLADDPAWHRGWMGDIVRSVGHLRKSFAMAENPRLRGPFEWIGG
ncbi:NAD(P)/FAD-dependent oxidoreductase [Erythrobacter sp. THAF29]|uniref:NAD(P)/FAD-dependent oxidoreductase n=1 Tax=Erythrobacter sp. THAF29 TaxID=2587851 RepID=UPI001268758C|nr:NAD(P)/FAD-dependent oxidoreductase [Erythrobacter sp. THAF29]QFT76920.1 Putative oxidoreductase [Erythrobacter sp. THAF29]